MGQRTLITTEGIVTHGGDLRLFVLTALHEEAEGVIAVFTKQAGVSFQSESNELMTVMRGALEGAEIFIGCPSGQGGLAGGGAVIDTVVATSSNEGSSSALSTPVAPKRFHGSVELDAERVSRDAGKIAEEVIAHRNGLLGARVCVTMEIEAYLPEGTPPHVVRFVTENARTLRFTTQGLVQQ